MSKNEPVANSYSVNTKCCGPEILTLMEENKMIRKGLIYLTTTLMILLLVSLAMAVIPPPPANQEIGIYDTVFTGFTTEECKECHTPPLADRHHLLVEKGYKCLDCHSLTGGEFDAFRECSNCHLISPHHATDAAQEFRCSECHGDFVDDYNDGHVIPTYDTSMITPDSSYKYINSATGLKIGGCEACHEPDSSVDPAIESNPNTHHNLTYFSENNCALCHGNEGATLDIRLCERCHGVKSLHNIQYDYDNTIGELGYGHIGNDWDCWGCHGWTELDISSASSLSDALSTISTSEYETFSMVPPNGTGVTVPYIDTVDPCAITAGQNTTITIYGSNFINTLNNVTYTSNVTLDNDLVLVPDSITTTEIVVTIPETLEQGNYDLWAVKNGYVRSNKKSLSVLPEVPPFVVVERKIME